MSNTILTVFININTCCHLFPVKNALKLSFYFLLSSLLQVMVKSVSEITDKPNMGCYIHGLFLEGARWDNEARQLIQSRSKELYTEMAVIWLIPKPERKPPTSGVYVCPIYKTLTRAGQYLIMTSFICIKTNLTC